MQGSNLENINNTENTKELSLIQAQLKAIYPIPQFSLTSASQTIKGFDFNTPLNYDSLISSYFSTGLQATNLSQAIAEITKMIQWRAASETSAETHQNSQQPPAERCTIFLGYTSNMVSSGLRETIRYLVQHKMVDVLVTTAGGIEEDLIKCFKPFYLGDFNVNDHELRKHGLNRIGNMLVPSENYCVFEDWVLPIFKEMYEEQKNKGIIYTPSKMIRKLGEKINNEESIYYWAYKNEIPVFCPAITDGALGDMLFFNSYKNEDFILDLIGDVRDLNKICLRAKKTGVIILGGGVVKHHIMNANIWRNGADFGVFINTGIMYDGSDSGATPSEAVSWGKIRMDGEYTKVFCEATLVFPIIVAQTFVKHFKDAKKN